MIDNKFIKVIDNIISVIDMPDTCKPGELYDIVNKRCAKAMDIVIPFKGRLDIDYVEKPTSRYGRGGFDVFQIGNLETIKVFHPDVWKALKKAIKAVDEAD